MTKMIVDGNFIKNNRDLVIYNYLAETKYVTVIQVKEDLEKRYRIKMTLEEVEKLLEEYVILGLLSPRKNSWVWNG